VVPDFTKSLNAKALAGKRIGVPRKVFLDNSVTGNDPSVNAAFTQALATLRALGATIVDPADLPSAEDYVTSYNETIVEAVDFKAFIPDRITHFLFANFFPCRPNSRNTQQRYVATQAAFTLWTI
jgi:amidase